MRNALLILPGFGGGRRARARIRAWAKTQPFEVHAPRYHRRAGLDATVAALRQYIEDERLAEADRLSVFCYIVGGWTLNLCLRDHPLPNLTHVVYDRSPFQEALARTFVRSFWLVARIRFGRLAREFAAAPYPPLDPEDCRIGLLIENRATRLARWLVKERDVPLAPEATGQPHDDAMYVRLDHDEMYTRFEDVAPGIVHFFEHGRFPEGAQREPFAIDPWSA